jgi:hypothetical protein
MSAALQTEVVMVYICGLSKYIIVNDRKAATLTTPPPLKESPETWGKNFSPDGEGIPTHNFSQIKGVGREGVANISIFYASSCLDSNMPDMCANNDY